SAPQLDRHKRNALSQFSIPPDFSKPAVMGRLGRLNWPQFLGSKNPVASGVFILYLRSLPAENRDRTPYFVRIHLARGLKAVEIRDWRNRFIPQSRQSKLRPIQTDTPSLISHLPEIAA